RHGDGFQNDDFPLTQGDCVRKNTDATRYADADASATVLHFSNEYFDPSAGAGCKSFGPSRVPSPYAGGIAQMFEDNSPFITRGGSATALFDGGLIPSTGDTIPGYVYRTSASTDGCVRCRNEAEGHWANGKWILEIRRSLVAPDADDV